MNHETPRPYQVTQLGPPDERDQQRNIPVTDLESLVTHHPRANAGASLVNGLPDSAENVRSRSYAVIGGEFQEVQTLRTDRKYQSLEAHQVLLIKDFILDDTGAGDSRRVDVPSPIAGVVGRVDIANGVVDVHEALDGPLVARIRHLGPIAVAVGDDVAYGQSLGTQNRVGLDRRAGKHVHIEMDTRHHQQFGNYMLDLVEARLPVPASLRAGVAPRAFVDDGVQRVGESGGRVAAVQRALAAAGYLGADGNPIVADGIYRLSMQGALLQFQQDQGLDASGDVDAPTWRAALDVSPGRPLAPPKVVEDAPVRLPLGQPSLLDRIRGRLGNLEPTFRPEPGGDEHDRVACSLLRLASEHRFQTVDHVLVGGAPADASGPRLIMVQGRLDDPAQLRASMPLAEARATPVAESLARLRTLQDMDAPHGPHGPHGPVHAAPIGHPLI